MSQAPTQKKINKQIAEKFETNESTIEQVLDLYYKGIAAKIREDVPCEVRMPFLGNIYPKQSYLDEFKEKWGIEA